MTAERLSAGQVAALIAAEFEIALAESLAAQREAIAAAIEALPAHHFTTVRGAIRESAQIAREAS